jgi:acetyl-CoA synthetase
MSVKNEIIWRPSEEYSASANVRRLMDRHGIDSYAELVARSVADIRWFWEACLDDLGVQWYAPYSEVLDDSRGFPWGRWFVSGKINLVHNCLDRHLETRPDQVAVVWEGDDGQTRTVTYRELNSEVCRIAAGMHELGIGRHDTVGIYMPMVPEIVAALFAAWKIGAVAVPVFAGFGPEALAVRLRDSGAKLLFTADGSYRRGKQVRTKDAADQALQSVPSVKSVIVLRRTGEPISWVDGRDLWWDRVAVNSSADVPTEQLDAEDLCLVLYTSGTTGRPKGTLHTQGGTLAKVAKELAYFMDVKTGDRFFWLTDMGWMMGPWEIIGTTFLGASVLLFEGAPNWPNPDRLWKMVDRHRLTHLGISPTAVRLLRRSGDAWVERHDLDSLRILASTGEPWDLESYLWFFHKVGRGRRPIINISGGTELMGCLLAAPPMSEMKPCSLGGPGLGMDVDVVDDEGRPVRNTLGYLVLKQPAPSMTRGFLNDPQRYIETYFSRWPGVWFHGDWALVDKDGFWFIHGRADDTIKVAGKRTGPAEVESALIAHDAVSEAAAIGIPDELKGETVACFAVLKPGNEWSDQLSEDLSDQVVEHLGKTLRPRFIYFVSALPKTRSGKIVRGAIRRRFLGESDADISSIENPEALEAIPRLTIDD